MPSFLRVALNSVSNLITHMSMTQWAITGICLIVVGIACMRGYGSRSNY